MHWLKIFNRVAAGSLAVLLSGCTTIKAPKTLFITLAVEQNDFQGESKRIRTFLDRYTEAFQRSNPETRIVWITYKTSQFHEQVARDSALHLGPDLIIIDHFSAPELLEQNLTTTLPDQKYFDNIYSPRIQSASKTYNKYTFAPWLINTQVACFNTNRIKSSPSTIEDLEELSASGKKVGLSSELYGLLWTAGTQGAIAELSSPNKENKGNQKYMDTQKWLNWLQKAALYRNISFHPGSKDLAKKLISNELDWVTCWGTELEELKDKMGDDLGVAALPDGSASEAFSNHIIYGFALGKNSSPAQRKMAMKFIKTDVNKIAQRKLQLDDVGFLAANNKVSISPENSKILTALDTSYNIQSKSYSEEWPGITKWLFSEEHNLKSRIERYTQLSRTFKDLINGYLSTGEALKTITNTQGN